MKIAARTDSFRSRTSMNTWKQMLFGVYAFILFGLAVPIHAQQLWSGILDPSRAVTWQGNAGFPGGTLPDSSWAQCVTTACNTVTSAGASATAAQINAALASALSNTYVALAAGTYNLTAPLILSDYESIKSNVVLRGAGANQTLIVFNSITGGGCYGNLINLEGSCAYVNGGEQNVCVFAGASTTSTVTAGTYTQGSTYLSITNCGTSTPATGSLSNLAVGSIIMVDQLAETNDTGTIWNCAVTAITEGGAGCAGNGDGGGMRTNGPCNGLTCERVQAQGFTVLGISGSVVHVAEPLYLSQWRTGQQPQAWFPSTSVSNVGIENLSINATSATGFGSNINLLACNQCWVAGVRSIDANRSHVRTLFSVHEVIRDSYFYLNQSDLTVSYGYEITGGWYHLLENNITQQITDSDPSCTGPCAGNVIDYNFDVDNAYGTGSGYIVPPFFLHSGGDVMNLWEGNIGPGFSTDNIHGTHHFETVFRNTLPGWSSNCPGMSKGCIVQTIPITLTAGSRYMNIVGNVLGQAATPLTGATDFHTTYTCNATSTAVCSAAYQANGSHDAMIYNTGYIFNTYSPVAYAFCNSLPAGSCTSTGSGATSSPYGDWDAQVFGYLLRWGNYDVVTGAVRWCGNSSDTGWSTTCGSSSEIPTTISSYSNAVPSYGDTSAGQSAMPASFYYSSKPSFLSASVPWPVAGPDVTGGNLGNCSGGSYAGMAATTATQCGASLVTAWAGHSNANQAMLCYLNTMGGPPDGTGSVLSFNAASCYGAPQTGTSPVPPPTSVTAVPVPVTQ
jgi:hypothetical protein